MGWNDWSFKMLIGLWPETDGNVYHYAVSRILPSTTAINFWLHHRSLSLSLRTISYLKWKRPMSTLRNGSLCICLPKATALHQDTQAVCENWFLAISSWSLWINVVHRTQDCFGCWQIKKNGLRKIASSREGCCCCCCFLGGLVDSCMDDGGLGDSPFLT